MSSVHTLDEVLGFARALVPAASKSFPGCEVYLFGSYAKGCAFDAFCRMLDEPVPQAALALLARGEVRDAFVNEMRADNAQR